MSQTTQPPTSQAALSAARLERLVMQQNGPRLPETVLADDPQPIVQALARRQLGAAQARAQNLLCQRRGMLSLRAGGSIMQVLLTGPRGLPTGSAWLQFTINGYPAQIGMSWDAARRLSGLPLESSDPSDAALLIEDSLAPWLDDIEIQTGLAVRFLELTSKPAPAEDMVQLGLRMDVMNKPPALPYRQHMPLQLSPAAAEALAPSLAIWTPPSVSDPQLLLRVTVEIDNMRISMAELKTLAPGDALVLTERTASAQVLVESQFSALAQAASHEPLPSVWTLSAPFSLRARQQRLNKIFSLSEVVMSDTESPQPTGASENFEHHPQSPSPQMGGTPAQADPRAAAGGPQTLDMLELRLSFRLGETLMPLADLRKAGPGTIITLDRPDGAMVDILANGQLIGTGEVISVAGQRAIEIRSLFGEG